MPDFQYSKLFSGLTALRNSKISTPMRSPVERWAMRNEPQPAPNTSVHMTPMAESSSLMVVGGMIRYQPMTSV